MSARALCENVQQVARTQGAAVRHDRVERVSPLGGSCGSTSSTPVPVGHSWAGETMAFMFKPGGVRLRNHLVRRLTMQGGRRRKTFKNSFESDLARDTASSSTKFDNCFLAAAVVRSIA
jgi:hypothetical protein